MARTTAVPSWWMLCACLAWYIIHAHAVSNYVPNDGPCLDKNAQCMAWADAGNCATNRTYMWANCWAACSSACARGKGEVPMRVPMRERGGAYDVGSAQ
jgi:hypothetical protein